MANNQVKEIVQFNEQIIDEWASLFARVSSLIKLGYGWIPKDEYNNNVKPEDTKHKQPWCKMRGLLQ